MAAARSEHIPRLIRLGNSLSHKKSRFVVAVMVRGSQVREAGLCPRAHGMKTSFVSFRQAMFICLVADWWPRATWCLPIQNVQLFDPRSFVPIRGESGLLERPASA